MTLSNMKIFTRPMLKLIEIGPRLNYVKTVRPLTMMPMSQSSLQLVYSSVRSMSTDLKSTLNLPPDIEFQELMTKLGSKEIQLIDVRSPKELVEDGYVPGSINFPLTNIGDIALLSPEDFKDQFGFSKPSYDAPLATMCILGIRARTAQLALKGAGYSNVRRYGGSLEDWKQNEGEVSYDKEE